MRKTILLLIVCIAFAGANAQTKSKKANAPASQYSIEELIDTYRFKEAAQQANKELQTAKRKNADTRTLEQQIAAANIGQNMIASTEDVVFIDSIVVDKQKLLSVYRIGNEAGKLDYLKNMLKGKNTTEKYGNYIAYAPQLNDKIFYSCPKDSSVFLYTRDRLDDNWGEAKQVPGLEDFGYDQITPYVLNDGATLYFAAKGEESLGGYDIFMSRYSQDTGEFLKPENIGMPFNSPANDYLYVIDEANNIGWFATDRQQPEDKVCVYVFIPNETRKNINSEIEIDDQALVNFAKINSIKATWAGENDRVKSATERLKNVFAAKDIQQSPKDFTFVVNDSKTYHSLNDFKAAKAKEYARQWIEATKKQTSKTGQLQKDRDVYSKATANEKKAMTQKILSGEKELEAISESIKKLEKRIRQEELKH